MKITFAVVFSIFLLFIELIASDSLRREKAEAFFSEIRNAVIRNDVDWISNQISCPMGCFYENVKTEIITKDEFIKHYDFVFNRYVMLALLGYDPVDIFENWQGFSFGHGAIWIEQPFSLNAHENEGISFKIKTINNRAGTEVDMGSSAAAETVPSIYVLDDRYDNVRKRIKVRLELLRNRQHVDVTISWEPGTSFSIQSNSLSSRDGYIYFPFVDSLGGSGFCILKKIDKDRLWVDIVPIECGKMTQSTEQYGKYILKIANE